MAKDNHQNITELAFCKVQEADFCEDQLLSLKDHVKAADIVVPHNWKDVGCRFALHIPGFIKEEIITPENLYVKQQVRSL